MACVSSLGYRDRAELIVIDDFDHVCYCEDLWPSVLARINESLGKKP